MIAKPAMMRAVIRRAMSQEGVLVGWVLPLVFTGGSLLFWGDFCGVGVAGSALGRCSWDADRISLLCESPCIVGVVIREVWGEGVNLL